MSTSEEASSEETGESQETQPELAQGPYNERDTFMMLVCSPCSFVQWYYLSDQPEVHLARFTADHGHHQR